MSRPPKCRRIAFVPGATYFKPYGTRLRSVQEVQLSLEEVEALRLKDLEGLEQGDAAEKMNVSRPTFQRVLSSARQKLALALLSGMAIRIEGGHFEMARRVRCGTGHEWDASGRAVTDSSPGLCPSCNSPAIPQVLPEGSGWSRGGRHGAKGRWLVTSRESQRKQQKHEEGRQ
jgi:predicted DNA-binding protein (UPF0251 family)